jgi:cytidylate kinase
MIITVSRQFGSGGREVGKRLADELGLSYYDKEIIEEIAKSTSLNKDYVDSVLENGGYKNHVFSFGHSLPFVSPTPNTVTEVLVAQQKVITAIGATGNCVVVGRCADVILHSHNPFKIFVYADETSKLARCRQRAEDSEDLTDKQYIKKFKDIDKNRKALHELFASSEWGDKDSYDLMINTSNVQIKEIIPAVAQYIKAVIK